MNDVELPQRSRPIWVDSIIGYRERAVDGREGLLPLYLVPALTAGIGWLIWSLLSGSWNGIRLAQVLAVLASSQWGVYKTITQTGEHPSDVAAHEAPRTQKELRPRRPHERHLIVRYGPWAAVVVALGSMAVTVYALETNRLPYTVVLAGLGLFLLAPAVSKARTWIRNRRLSGAASLEAGALGLTLELGLLPVSGTWNSLRTIFMVCLVASAICFWCFRCMADLGSVID